MQLKCYVYISAGLLKVDTAVLRLHLHSACGFFEVFVQFIYTVPRKNNLIICIGGSKRILENKLIFCDS